jgi:hypothetical protein
LAVRWKHSPEIPHATKFVFRFASLGMNYGHNRTWWLEWFGDFIFYLVCDALKFLVSSLLELLSGL